MPWIPVGVMSHRCWQVLAWSGLMAAALLLASLFQAVATAGTDGAVQVEPTSIHLSPATTALANGQDASAVCEMIVGQPLYAGQNVWVTQTLRQCAHLARPGESVTTPAAVDGLAESEAETGGDTSIGGDHS